MVLVLTAGHEHEGDGYGSQDEDGDGRDDWDGDLHDSGEVHRDDEGSEQTDGDLHGCDIEEPVVSFMVSNPLREILNDRSPSRISGFQFCTPP